MAEARYKNMWTFLIESNYEDAADIDNDMRCTICTRILINAHNSVCGCRYCLDCVKAYLNGERRFCPGNADFCKAEELEIDSNIYPDHAINYRISKLIVKCRYLCGSRCELSIMEGHKRTCTKQPTDCSSVKVGCRETQLVTDRINEQLLGQNESHAKLLMMYINRLESEIALIKKDTIELQLSRKIDEAQADQIKQEVEHLRNENQLAKEQKNSLKAEIKKYRTEYLELVNAVEQHSTEIRAMIQTQSSEKALRVEKYSHSEQKLAELEKRARKEKEELKKQATQIRDVERQMRRIRMDSELPNHREFVWPIDGWLAKTRAARNGSCKEIFSEPFYSHDNGYKMCLSVWPEGRGHNKGTYLSVYFHIMKGPFGNILTWPFQHHVTFSVINQLAGNDIVKGSTLFRELPYNVKWNKPSRERNEGIGESRIIELAELLGHEELCRYNQIFIRCVVRLVWL